MEEIFLKKNPLQNKEEFQKTLGINKKIFFPILGVALILIGLLIFFVLQIFNLPSEKPPELSPEAKNDKIRPTTAIVSPKADSWYGKDFIVTINDSDIGGAELMDFVPKKRGCQYIIEDLGTDRVAGGFRKCDPVEINIPVGIDKICSSSYQKNNSSQGKCMVSTKSFDKNGNDSGWKSRIFNIDLIKPVVGKIAFEQALELNKTYSFQITVSDNGQITGCWFFVNEKEVKERPQIEPVPCGDDNQCTVNFNYSFDKEGEYKIQFICTDLGDNVGVGEPIIVKTTTSRPPIISSCRVNPIQGFLETEFKFQVEASDPDGDEIFYSWNFGDGKTSDGKTPTHYYSAVGTFEPRLIIKDSKGLEAKCSTAWVSILE